jgi:hypothetical protein
MKRFYYLNWAQPWPTFFVQPAASPLPTGPRPLDRPSSPSRPSRLGVGGALPDCRLPHEKTNHLTRLRPSSCLADRWAPPVITLLRLRPSSTPHRRLVEQPWLSCPPLCPLSLWLTITTPLFLPPIFNFHCRLLPSSLPRHTSSGPINWPPRPRRSPHLPHLTLPPLPKHECPCCRALSPPPFPRRRPVATLPPEPR